MLIGSLGSAGLIAFTVGAFSFFSGLADPRARTPRVMPVAATMPDLKDGVPALAAEDGTAQAATFNLPRTSPSEPQPARSAPARTEPPARSAALPAPPVLAEAAQDSRAEATTGSPGQAPTAVPPIQNAAVIAEAPRMAALVPPARAETVKAKAGQPSTFVALPAATKPQRDREPVVHETRKTATKAAVQKDAARGKPVAVRSVAEAAAVPQQAAAHPADDEDAIPGSRQIRAGLKAIGGMFGSSDGE